LPSNRLTVEGIKVSHDLNPPGGKKVLLAKRKGGNNLVLLTEKGKKKRGGDRHSVQVSNEQRHAKVPAQKEKLVQKKFMIARKWQTTPRDCLIEKTA